MKAIISILTLVITTMGYSQSQSPVLLGMTSSGGTSDTGVIFSYNINSGSETTIHNFGGSDGAAPTGSFFQASNGLVYGMTDRGGTYGYGTIISYNFSTDSEKVLYSFGNGLDGKYPGNGAFIQVGDSLLYGLTSSGGVDTNNNKQGGGTLFSFNIYTGAETVLHSFGSGTDGNTPLGALFMASNGLLYGITNGGGIYNLFYPGYGDGTIFSYNITTGAYAVVHNFGNGIGNGTDGNTPWGTLIQIGDSLLYSLASGGGDTTGGGAGLGIIYSYNIYTDSETVLYQFKGSSSDGAGPNGSIIQVGDSLLYGLTEGSGAYYYGTLFSYNIFTHQEKVLHNFGNGIDGEEPEGTLINGGNGLLYGLTIYGGVDTTWGTIFSFNIATDSETVLHSFLRSDGAWPWGNLIFLDSIPVVTTAINQISLNTEKPSIFPNPTRNNVTIANIDLSLHYNFAIANALGQVVYQAPLNQNTIDMTRYADGIYSLIISNETEKFIEKLIVAR